MKALLMLAAVMMFVACGAQKVPVTITNDLGSWDIHEIYIRSHRADEWGSNLITSPIAPGAAFNTELNAGEWDFRAVDEDGDTYTRYEEEVRGESFSWKVTLAEMDW